MSFFEVPDDALQVTAYKLTFRYLNEICAAYVEQDDAWVMGKLRSYALLAPDENSGQPQDVGLTLGDISCRVPWQSQLVFPKLTAHTQ